MQKTSTNHLENHPQTQKHILNHPKTIQKHNKNLKPSKNHPKTQQTILNHPKTPPTKKENILNVTRKANPWLVNSDAISCRWRRTPACPGRVGSLERLGKQFSIFLDMGCFLGFSKVVPITFFFFLGGWFVKKQLRALGQRHAVRQVSCKSRNSVLLRRLSWFKQPELLSQSDPPRNSHLPGCNPTAATTLLAKIVAPRWLRCVRTIFVGQFLCLLPGEESRSFT